MKKVLLLLLFTSPALAHHEAIFGPQSSVAFSAPVFVSLQAFHKAHDTEGETTLLLSAGLAPNHHSKGSLAVILPVSVGHHGAGIENIVVGGRYRLDLDRLQERLGKDGNFVQFMGGMEIPNGNVDRPAFSGNSNWLAAVLYSFEWRALSLISYVFYRLDADGDGDRLYEGLGVAYTPYEKHGRLVSFQAGVSHETHFQERRPVHRADILQQVMVNPTFVAQVHPQWQLFVTASIGAYGSSPEADRWRLGAGIIYLIGGHAHE
jgi:hypothetical protein